MGLREAALAAATMLAAMLAGCAAADAETIARASATPTGRATATASEPSALPTSMATPEPEPATLVLGIDSFASEAADGSVLAKVDFADGVGDGPALLDLLVSALGPAQSVEGAVTVDAADWQWSVLRAYCGIDDESWKSEHPDGSFAAPHQVVPTSCQMPRIYAAASGGVQLRTSQGVAVGDSLTKVLATPGATPDLDFDGDGSPDQVLLEVREEPGKTSNTGGIGHTEIVAHLQQGVVASLYVGSDFGD